jgi:putative nucleotidyltransferase with HDIG domain
MNRLLLTGQWVLLAALAAAAMLTSRSADWAPTELVLALGALAVGAHLFPLEAPGVRVSTSFMGLVLAMALLGPAPAVAIGLAGVLVDAAVRRPRAEYFASDLIAYAAFPLAGGLMIRVIDVSGDLGHAFAVGGVFVAANLLNFVLIVGQMRLHRLRDTPLPTMFRRAFLPVLPWELAAAFTTAMVVFGYDRLGTGVVGVVAMLVLVLQLLLRSVLQAQARGEELEARLDDLGVMHAGLMAVMMDTLSLRDPMTARHSAAVARYAREVAEAAGLSQDEQELAHTAGLVHDIGKAIFTDELLTSAGPLSDEQYAMIRRHPDEGARILSRVRGYEEIAEIVRAHHERMDGSGYPRGLAGEEIPVISRIISVADTYDAMTARDSYRNPVPHEAAVDELRRVSGTQLDPRFVELFLDRLEAGVRTGPATDADLETAVRRERFRQRPRPLVN